MKKFLFFFFVITLLIPSKIFAQYPDFSKVWGANAVTNGSIFNSGEIITDSNGYVYIAGSFQNKVAFGQDTLIPNGFVDMFLAKYSPQGDFVWVKQYGCSSFDVITSLAIDSQNNIYATGVFRDTVNFDGFMLQTAAEMQDGFIMKLNTDGTIQWIQQTNVEPNPSSISNSAVYQQLVVTIDHQDNLILSCPFWGILNFQGHHFVSPQASSLFTKIAPDGNIIWIKVLGGAVNASISFDARNNIFLIGSFSFANPLNFDGTEFFCTGNTDTYISKFNSGSALKWVKVMTGISWQEGKGSVCDKKGNVYVTGEFNGTTFFENQTFSSRGGSDGFITKLDSSGNYKWLKHIGGGALDTFTSIDIDSAENLIAAGYFFGNACLIENETISSLNYSMGDIFTVKYNGNGQLMGIQQAGGLGDDYVWDIHISKDNVMYLTGSCSPSANFGNVYFQSGSPNYPLYVAKVSLSSCDSVLNLTSPTNDYSNAMQFKVANQQITATNKLTGNTNALYQAGKHITLLPGFTANAGSVFKTRIASCK